MEFANALLENSNATYRELRTFKYTKGIGQENAYQQALTRVVRKSTWCRPKIQKVRRKRSKIPASRRDASAVTSELLSLSGKSPQQYLEETHARWQVSRNL
jgi:hypothetical protein